MRGLRVAGAVVACTGASFAAGAIGALLQGPTTEVRATYLAFDLPSWAPPADAFGIVWPVLYTLVGLAAARLWLVGRRDDQRLAIPLALWGAQLAVNAVWPAVFFGQDALGWAVLVIVALDLLVLATLVTFARRDRLAAWLLAPYLVWITYATALNIAVWTLNP